jgi:hypothetical protein
VAIYALAAVVVLRWGLLALAAAYFFEGLLVKNPVTLEPAAWYFTGAVLDDRDRHRTDRVGVSHLHRRAAIVEAGSVRVRSEVTPERGR